MECFCTPLCKYEFYIKVIDFYQSYSPVAYVDYFRINIVIADMHRITARMLDVSNAFQNRKFPINERVCVSPPTYYLDSLDISYPNISINRDECTFCLQFMNGIQGTKPAGRKWNRPLDAVFTIIKYKKITIEHTIYIKVFSDEIFSYIMVSNDYVINTTNNTT